MTALEWPSTTRRFQLGDLHGYLIAGWDGDRLVYLDVFGLGEALEARRVLDAILRLVRDLLGRGASVEEICVHLCGTRFEPSGPVPGIGIVTSLADLAGRWVRSEAVKRAAPKVHEPAQAPSTE